MIMMIRKSHAKLSAFPATNYKSTSIMKIHFICLSKLLSKPCVAPDITVEIKCALIQANKCILVPYN